MFNEIINTVKVLANSYKNYCEASRNLTEVHIKMNNK